MKDYCLSAHRDLMEKLGRQGISSDESDYNQKPPVFYRISPVWRSMELRDFMWQLDGMAAQDNAQSIGRRRRGRNQRTRQRLRTDRINGESSAPIGLPRNCYDGAWLNTLSRRQLAELEMTPNHDFSIMEELGRSN
ncbi:hypothetical protein F5887DRAFT_881624 [Amanita rubescens]|nr:hypothetical protein F5887DRAFT_881624 [Amanita rubescens]